MAEKRMFAKSIVLTDAFLDMPMSARCLYFTLGMLADDDGFVGSPKSVMRQCGASTDDMNVLLAKRFVLAFESGVIVIKHWRINNYLRNDTYHETNYQEEKETLKVDQNGAYTERIRAVNVDKISIDKISTDKNSKDNIYREFAGDNKELLLALEEFESMRNRIKKPLTDGARKRMLTKLSTFPKHEWVDIIHQSIDHCWQGLFPLDKPKAEKKTNNIFLEMLGEEYGQNADYQDTCSS